jgi:hypothetical protein
VLCLHAQAEAAKKERLCERYILERARREVCIAHVAPQSAADHVHSAQDDCSQEHSSAAKLATAVPAVPVNWRDLI